MPFPFLHGSNAISLGLATSLNADYVTNTCEVQVTSSHNILPLFFTGNAASFSLHAESADLNDKDDTDADTAVIAQSLTMAAQPIEFNLTAHAAQLTLPMIAGVQCRSCHFLLISR